MNKARRNRKKNNDIQTKKRKNRDIKEKEQTRRESVEVDSELVGIGQERHQSEGRKGQISLLDSGNLLLRKCSLPDYSTVLTDLQKQLFRILTTATMMKATTETTALPPEVWYKFFSSLPSCSVLVLIFSYSLYSFLRGATTRASKPWYPFASPYTDFLHVLMLELFIYVSILFHLIQFIMRGSTCSVFLTLCTPTKFKFLKCTYLHPNCNFLTRMGQVCQLAFLNFVNKNQEIVLWNTAKK